MAKDRVFTVTLLVYLDDEFVEEQYGGDGYTAAVSEAVNQWNVDDVQEVEQP